jgi:xanthine dehydrogenase small subunit
LVGQPWNEATVEGAAEVMAAEGTPIDDMRASAAFRSAMMGQSLLKFYYESTTGALI